MTDPLTGDQRQRLAVLYAPRDALHVELDAFDLISCAHWVATGRHAPTIEDVPGSTTDAARWSPTIASEPDSTELADRVAREFRMRGPWRA